jgi:type II secretion system protein I
MNARSRRGFTIIEVILAMIVLSIALLGLLGASALATRTLGRARVADEAAVLANNRIERLRLTACANQSSGADTLFRGGAWYVINSWSYTASTNSTWRIQLVKKYVTGPRTIRTDVVETEVSCLF